MLWMGVSTIFMQLFNTIRNGVTFLNDLNKAQTNIMMITGKSKSEVMALTVEYSNLATQLHETTQDIMKASEEFLRAGHNQAETLKLLQSSTIMSKIAGQDQKSTAEQLIAITNGFGISAEKTMGIVDKLTTVDNQSATSTAELGTALEKTSSSAQEAGSSFENLVSYIATVSSVTRKSASSIGESFKTIFARFQDVKQGKEFDAEGESLSHVEQSFNELGIAVRKNATTFKDFDQVLKYKQKIVSKFGLNVASMVTILTHSKKRQNYQQYIDDIIKSNSDVIWVKIADMLQNVTDNPNEKQRAKYRMAFPKLIRALEKRW